MWTQQEIHEQVEMINGQASPDLVITNATYLHSIYKKWCTGNIWVHKDRIVYVGKEMPAMMSDAEVVDAAGKKIVPGYIEPHVHPFQLYNPQTFAAYAGALGTTTFIADNLKFFINHDNETAFTLLNQLKKQPVHYYWWARMDSQTALQDEGEQFNPEEIMPWLLWEDVLLAGELTGWPRLLSGDPNMFATVQAAKESKKKIEGHLPGASERTLARMKLLGIDGDHEAMTLEEVEMRLLHGYAVTLRHSSIRPDLPDLLQEIVEAELDIFDHLMMTTDGATPSFHIDGVMDKCIQVALDAGVPAIDAYLMASYNVARYYDMTDVHGVIATGRYATFNFLEDETNPVPTDVLSKGIWLKRNGQDLEKFEAMDWSLTDSFAPTFELYEEDFIIDHAFGIEMVNDVITKPYEITIDTSVEALSKDHDESFLMLLSREGEWRVNTVLKGFASSVEGIASSYSTTGDIILIGKDKRAMHLAFEKLKELGGGMVLVENHEAVETLPLSISGGLSSEPMDVLIEQELALKKALHERGYNHVDAVYTFLFLQATHLPYVRVTPIGIYDVMKNKILVPVTER